MMVLALFFYVGAEVSVSSGIPLYLKERFDVDINRIGLLGTGLFFAALTVGRFSGGLILNWIKPAHFFVVTCLLSLAGLLGLFIPSAPVAVASFFLIGLGFANIFPLIFSMVIDHMPAQANALSGLMVMAIVGGAVVPPLMGLVADSVQFGAGIVPGPAGGPGVHRVDGHALISSSRFRSEVNRMTIQTDRDPRIVMTLDAGGTTLKFSAIRANQLLAGPIALPSEADHLERCLGNLVRGFETVKAMLPEAPVAISFAFPGPADYPAGIIANIGNLPAFRGGVPLGAILEEKFGVPVFINNDGDLFVYGEAISGFLPYVNELLAKAGSPKRYHNLFGLTLGTGLGGGIVRNGELFIGDNSAAGEVWLLRNKLEPGINAEEGASIRAVRRVYAREAGIAFADAPEPRVICDIGMGRAEGNQGRRARSVPAVGRSRRRRARAGAHAGGRAGGDRRRHLRRASSVPAADGGRGERRLRTQRRSAAAAHSARLQPGGPGAAQRVSHQRSAPPSGARDVAQHLLRSAAAHGRRPLEAGNQRGGRDRRVRLRA